MSQVDVSLAQWQLQARELLKNLVSIRSPSGQEREACEFLVGAMQQLAFDEAYIDGAGNAVGIRHGHQNSECPRTVVLLGHIDTVGGWPPVVERDEALYGRGSVDAKGPLASFVMAASQAELPADVRVVVIGAVEEESASSKGARHAAQSFQPHWCVIGEPSGSDAITLGYKGRLLADWVMRQPEGHSAGPQTGVIERAIRWWNDVTQLADQYNRERERLFDQLLPTARAVHSSSDGLETRVQFKIGFRLPLGFEVELLQRQLTALAPEAAIEFSGYEPAIESDRRNALVTRLSNAIRPTGHRPKFKLKTGTSDMNVVGPIWQCPLVAYGPGDSSLDHTPDEHLPWAEYERAIQVLKTLLEQA